MRPYPITCAPDCDYYEYEPGTLDPEDSCEGSGDSDDY